MTPSKSSVDREGRGCQQNSGPYPVSTDNSLFVVIVEGMVEVQWICS